MACNSQNLEKDLFPIIPLPSPSPVELEAVGWEEEGRLKEQRDLE